MSSDLRCKFCGEEPLHGTTCCWCWVVEEGRPPHEGHVACMLAAKRLGPIRARFGTAIEATRENCLQIMRESLRQPLEAMPPILAKNFRRRPEVALQAVLETAYQNLETAIRARIKRP